MSWLQLPGFIFVVSVLLAPCLLLELWEAWVLFSAARDNRGSTPAATLLTTALRKRLARQLYGQGVIMGNAVLAVCHRANTADVLSNNDTYALVATGSYYASLWLAWMVLCHYYNSLPPEDIIATPIRKNNTPKKSKRNQGGKSGFRRSGSGISMGSTDSIAPVQKPRRSRRRTEKILQQLT